MLRYVAVSAATSDSSTCQGFSTQAGHRGAHLSGGQRLVRNFHDLADAINSWRQFAAGHIRYGRYG